MKRTAIPAWLREHIYERDGYRCRYCHTNEGPLQLDHVRPWSWGGRDTVENLVTACRSCNLSKGAQEWIPTAHVEIARKLVMLDAQRRQRLLERLAAEAGHVIGWTPRVKKKRIVTGMDWWCSCSQGRIRYASVHDFRLAGRRHLEWGIGVDQDPLVVEEISGPPMFMEPLRRKRS